MNCTSLSISLSALLPANTHCRRANEREKQSLLVDRDAKNNAVRTHETELHRLELEESECRNKLRDKDELERRIEEMKAEIVAANTRLKVPSCVLSPQTSRAC